LVLGLDGGVCKPVGAVGDHSGEDVVEADNAGVVEQVNEEGNGVVNAIVVGAEVGLIEGGGISVGDVEVVDQPSGGVLEGKSGSPATEGDEEGKTEGEPIELSLVGSGVSSSILGSVVFVHLSGNSEGGEDDLDAEGEEGNDPGNLEGTEGTREPSVSTVSEEVGTLIFGRSGPVLGSDSRRDGGISSIGGREDT